MSLFGSLSASVSGIQAQGTTIGIISDNIANVNTIGYKAGSQSFSTLVTNSGSSVAYSPGGVRVQNQQLIDQQGLIQTTNSPLDISISGDGFFVVSPGLAGVAGDAGVAYTRAGSFRTDSLGNFVNSSGQFLQAWPVDGEGRLPGEGGEDNATLTELDSLDTVNISSASGDANATTRVELGLNLNASQATFAGAGDIGTPGAELANSENLGVSSDQILVPNANLTTASPSALTVTDSDGATFTYTYGGFDSSIDLGTTTTLGAGSATATFTGPANGDAFTITLSEKITEPYTFTFTTSSSPNAADGEFNSLDSLADAINQTTDVIARIDSDALFISTTNTAQDVTFAAVGVPTTDFVTVLELDDITGGVDIWNTLDGLAGLVNSGTSQENYTAEISDGNTDSAAINIFSTDPEVSVTFTDTDDVIGELGLSSVAIAASYSSLESSDTSMASGNVDPQFERGIRIYDSLGAPHDIRIGFLKIGNNTWSAEIYATDPNELASGNARIAAGEVAFNIDGTLESVGSGLTTIPAFQWANDSISALTIDAGTADTTDGVKQFSGSYNVDFVNQNGAPVGLLDSVSIDEEGFITANFNNGETKVLYKIPLADFANPNGLISSSGNVFTQSFDSGTVNLKQVGEGGIGTISPSSLENANTDLSEELTDMIVAQRAYQASAKVITTADELLEELNRVT